MCVICCCGKVFRLGYRRLALKQVLPIPRQLLRIHTATTIPLWKVGCIKEPLMFYRIHGKNRRAHDNLPHLIEQREDTAACINKAAASVGLSNCDIQRDVDYRSLKLCNSVACRTEALQILGLSLQESIAIRRSPSDDPQQACAARHLRHVPSEGSSSLRTAWLFAFQLLGQEPKK